jgi:hypothetical protein
LLHLSRLIFLASCVQARSTHPQRSSPAFVLPPRLFLWPVNQIDSLGDGRGNKRHRRWCWMTLVTIVRRFGGHRWTWFRWLSEVVGTVQKNVFI